MATPEMEKFSFKADIAQLMSLTINTFYDSKAVSLRELISNASDAPDKARNQPTIDADKPQSNEDPVIRLASNPLNRTSTVESSIIGMSKPNLSPQLKNDRTVKPKPPVGALGSHRSVPMTTLSDVCPCSCVLPPSESLLGRNAIMITSMSETVG